VILIGDLISLPIEDYDAILGMDWLSWHYARVDCERKLVHFYKPGEDIFEFRGKKVKEVNCLILGVKARKLLSKSCTEFLAYLLNKSTKPEKIEEVPVVNEYLDVFPTELTQVPPDREMTFAVDLIPTAEPVSWTPYQMARVELKELKDQLQEL
jgi:hypothetical protein